MDGTNNSFMSNTKITANANCPGVYIQVGLFRMHIKQMPFAGFIFRNGDVASISILQFSWLFCGNGVIKYILPTCIWVLIVDSILDQLNYVLNRN